ncbi:hypothetical protein FGO68_gene17430 [Halteria grandinella]|uniref:Uncharacterized protein n=1 Tax=Halteria grandinella TaxID=5974 RepID=A0A8J8NTW4_HALGN|nr:hypothetical protein FGO68_gene17430 [Halteria grandinella]
MKQVFHSNICFKDCLTIVLCSQLQEEPLSERSQRMNTFVVNRQVPSRENQLTLNMHRIQEETSETDLQGEQEAQFSPINDEDQINEEMIEDEQEFGEILNAPRRGRSATAWRNLSNLWTDLEDEELVSRPQPQQQIPTQRVLMRQVGVIGQQSDQVTTSEHDNERLRIFSTRPSDILQYVQNSRLRRVELAWSNQRGLRQSQILFPRIDTGALERVARDDRLQSEESMAQERKINQARKKFPSCWESELEEYLFGYEDTQVKSIKRQIFSDLGSIGLLFHARLAKQTKLAFSNDSEWGPSTEIIPFKRSNFIWDLARKQVNQLLEFRLNLECPHNEKFHLNPEVYPGLAEIYLVLKKQRHLIQPCEFLIYKLILDYYLSRYSMSNDQNFSFKASRLLLPTVKRFYKYVILSNVSNANLLKELKDIEKSWTEVLFSETAISKEIETLQERQELFKQVYYHIGSTSKGRKSIQMRLNLEQHRLSNLLTGQRLYIN